jgi:hypothetical protein
VGDCAIRAVAKALNTDWESAYLMIAMNGFAMGDIMSSNNVWGSVLRQHGFYRYIVPNECPDCYTLKDFCAEHPKGLFVVGMNNHVATVENGDYFDAWDSGDELVNYYWTKEGKENGI